MSTYRTRPYKDYNHFYTIGNIIKNIRIKKHTLANAIGVYASGMEYMMARFT